MSTTHGWVGTPAIRVAVQNPADATGGVVICAPVGQEGVIAYRALRFLADELAARGIASVRYDPQGHGDSGPLGDAAADAVESAIVAADLLRSMGVVAPGFIGLGSAALVASAAAERVGGAAPLVLWDAPMSGKSWVRRQRALATMSIVGDRVGPDTESLVGVDLTAAELADFAAIRTAWDGDRPTLVAARPGGAVPADPPVTTDVIEIDGMPELLDGESIRARIPRTAIESIAGWTAAHLPRVPGPLRSPAVCDTLAVSADVHEVVRALGPDALFGIETVPAGAAPDAPVVVLHNGAAEHRVGASDYQVVLARTLAASGVRVVRFDRRATGESGPVSPEERSFLFTDEWIADQDHVVAAYGATGDRLGIVGMCAGAWLATRSVAHRPGLVVQISPNDYRRNPTTPGAYADALLAIDAPSEARAAFREHWNRWVPERIRHAVDRRGRRGGVAGQLTPLARAGSRVAMLMGPGDAELFDELGGQRVADRLPSVDVVRVPDGDHSLFSPGMRSVVLAEVTRRVTETLLAASQDTTSTTKHRVISR